MCLRAIGRLCFMCALGPFAAQGGRVRVCVWVGGWGGDHVFNVFEVEAGLSEIPPMAFIAKVGYGSIPFPCVEATNFHIVVCFYCR